MAKDTKGTQKEIKDRLVAKGLDKLTSFLNPSSAIMSPTPDIAKPVASDAQTGGGAIATIGNQKSEAQSKADEAAKHGTINTTMSAGNRAKHDEDIDTLITALSMFIPASVIERGGAILIGKLVGRLGMKTFKPQVVEEAAERILGRGFTSKKVGELEGKAMVDSWLDSKPAFERRNIDRNAANDGFFKDTDGVYREPQDIESRMKQKYGDNFYKNPDFVAKYLDDFKE